MKSGMTLLLALGLAATQGPALASPAGHSLASARLLMTNCTSDAPALRGMCLGYLAAIADGVARHQAMGSSPRTVCVPESVDLEAYRQAVLRFVQGTPAAVDRSSFEMVKSALEATWPCPR